MSSKKGNFVTIEGEQHEIYKEIKKEKFTIKFIKQEFKEDSLDEFYKDIAQIISKRILKRNPK